jgi:hypothetical protein
MTVETITLQLPENIVRQARQAASASRRTVEEVLATWVRPPGPPVSAGPTSAEDLSPLPDDELLQVARTTLDPEQARRLQALLDLQGERALTEAETAEAFDLVAEEDRLTLRRARALHVLQQRGMPPNATFPTLS